MQITVVCPHCQRSLHLHPDTVGKQVRCPQQDCGEIFEAVAASAQGEEKPRPRGREETAPGTPPPPARHESGSVGDIVPLLSAEEAEEVKQEPLPEATAAGEAAARKPDWSEAPPPVRRGAEEAKPTRPAEPIRQRQPTPAPARSPEKQRSERTRQPTPAPGSARADKGTVTPDTLPWQSAAPPVRKQDGPDKTPPAAQPEKPAVPPPPPTLRWRKYLVGTLLVAVVATLVIAVGVIKSLTGTEENLRADALAQFETKNYGRAAEQFEHLLDVFPDSMHRQDDRFHADLSRFLDMVKPRLEPKPADAYERYQLLAEKHVGSPRFNKQAKLVQSALLDLSRLFLEEAKKRDDPTFLDGADAVLRDADLLGATEQSDALRKEIGTASAAFKKAGRREAMFALLEELARRPGHDALENADELLDGAASEFPGVRGDERVRHLLGKILAARIQLVRWVPATDTPPARGYTPLVAGLMMSSSAPLACVAWLTLDAARGIDRIDELQPVVWAAPERRFEAALAEDESDIAFALVRGVLYALDRERGSVRWARRVGPDTLDLPVRLPGSGLALVPSSEPLALSARVVKTGRLAWRVPLESASVGQPVLAGRLAYLSTQAGRVHVIDVDEGKTLGHYEIGQALGGGAAYQASARHLFVPADASRLFVLDVSAKARSEPCRAILSTKHPAGSLRGAPLVIDRQRIRRDFMIDRDRLPDLLVLNQANGLETTSLRAFALPIEGANVEPISVLPECAGWTWFPPEVDPERLIQVTDRGVLTLAGIKQAHSDDANLFLNFEYEVAPVASPARAAMALVEQNDLWVLCGGELHELHFDPYRREMIRLGRTTLGAPVHGVQARQGDGRASLVTVTRGQARPTCLATAFAITAATPLTQGKPLTRLCWQRQLGVLCRSAPVAAGGGVLVVDEGGSLYRFGIGAPVRLTGPLTGVKRAQLVPGVEAGSAYVVAERARELLIWRQRGDGPIRERVLANSAALAGSPVATARGLVLPLRDGRLRYIESKESKSVDGPDWRSRRADREADCFLTPLKKDCLLVADGSRELRLWHWPGGMEWKRESSVELPARIVAAPAVTQEGRALEVVVADAAGTVHLLHATAAGAWSTRRQWPLAGRITAGPFRRAGRVVCLVDHNRLVCIDPEKDQPLWDNRLGRDVPVGAPLLFDNTLLLALRSGRLTALALATGLPTGSEIRLPAGVAPAAGLTLTDDNQLFLPLSDGTFWQGDVSLLGLNSPR